MLDPAAIVLASGNAHAGHHTRILVLVLVVLVAVAIVVGWVYYVRRSRARGSREG